LPLFIIFIVFFQYVIIYTKNDEIIHGYFVPSNGAVFAKAAIKLTAFVFDPNKGKQEEILHGSYI
jgi:hypothetical protein